MKVLNIVCRIASAVLGIAAFILFFGNFADIVSSDGVISLAGSQLAFRDTVEGASGTSYTMARSTDIFFCMILAAVGAILSACSFKSKRCRIAAPLVNLVPGIYMLVIALSPAAMFVDKRPLPAVRVTTYGPFVYYTAAALLLCAVVGIAAILINDRLEVLASNGAKLSIPAKVVRFFREYKSEAKKISWPNFRTVVKNTLIVLIVCAVFGAGVWLLDFGLGNLIKLIMGV